MSSNASPARPRVKASRVARCSGPHLDQRQGHGLFRGWALRAHVPTSCAHCRQPIEPGALFTRRSVLGGMSCSRHADICLACGPVTMEGEVG